MRKRTEFGYVFAQLDRFSKTTKYLREDIQRLQKALARVSSRVTILEQASLVQASGTKEAKKSSK